MEPVTHPAPQMSVGRPNNARASEAPPAGAARPTLLQRVATSVYGLAAYGFGLGATVYLMGWVADVLVPRSVDRGPEASPAVAVAVDLAVLLLFGLQHSVMARPRIKRGLARIVPKSIERSTYVALSGLMCVLLFVAWRPLPHVLLSADAWWLRAALWGLHGSGWVLMFGSTFAFDHLELLGLRQTVLGQGDLAARFRVPWLYRFVRHPMMVGWLLAFWGTPDLSVGRLLFASSMTVYVLIALHFEERDLVAAFGDGYRAYQARVPKLLPRPGRSATRAGATDEASV